MKAVVNALTTIVEDVRAFERRPRRDRAEVDVDALQALRERAEATLGNLVVAAKTHATSSGMSPVSLLDAAASHVSLTVTEIGKTVCIRKATKAEQEQFGPAQMPSSPPSSYTPSLRTVEETRSGHQRGTGSSGSRAQQDRLADLASSPPQQRSMLGRSSTEERWRPPSDPSTSSAGSPPPIFDRAPPSSAGMTSDESAPTEGPEDAWMELRVGNSSRLQSSRY